MPLTREALPQTRCLNTKENLSQNGLSQNGYGGRLGGALEDLLGRPGALLDRLEAI